MRFRLRQALRLVSNNFSALFLSASDTCGKKMTIKFWAARTTADDDKPDPRSYAVCSSAPAVLCSEHGFVDKVKNQGQAVRAGERGQQKLEMNKDRFDELGQLILCVRRPWCLF